MNKTFDFKIDDLEATIRHVDNLAFNRSTSSVGETKAILYIQDELEESNIKSKTEYFAYSGPKNLFMRLSYFFIFSYLLVNRLILIIAIYFSIKYLFATTREYSLVEKEDSKNLIAEISANNQDRRKRPVIIFSAHYDNFSANIPYRLQTIFTFIFRIIIIPFIIFTFSLVVWFLVEWVSENKNAESISNLVITYSIIEFFIVGIIFLLIYNTNKSSGSIDNASGVSVLIELIKILKKKPLENYDVVFLWCSGEEWGLIGSGDFRKKHTKELKKKYDLNNSFNINIDMVGTYIGLISKKKFYRKEYKINLNQVLENSAKDLDIPIEIHEKTIGPSGDYQSFLSLAKKTKTSFQVACFQSIKDNKYIHSTRDTPDKCSIKNLNGCLEICYQAIKIFDLKYEH